MDTMQLTDLISGDPGGKIIIAIIVLLIFLVVIAAITFFVDPEARIGRKKIPEAERYNMAFTFPPDWGGDTETVTNELVVFMLEKRVTKVWISPDIEVESTHGIEFIKMKDIQGMIVFGNDYPLQYYDCPVSVHLRLMELFSEVRKYGQVLASGNEGRPSVYLSPTGEARHILDNGTMVSIK